MSDTFTETEQFAKKLEIAKVPKVKRAEYWEKFCHDMEQDQIRKSKLLQKTSMLLVLLIAKHDKEKEARALMEEIDAELAIAW